MPLSPGARLGPYEIVAPLGAGGMGAHLAPGMGSFAGPGDAAEFHALLGDTSKAIEWLDRAVRKGDERVEWFRKNPRLASIRNDLGFQRIADSIQARRTQRQRK